MIYIASDHAGFELKEKLKIFLKELGYEIEDFGNFVYDENDDYPDFVRQVADVVAKNSGQSRGIVIGGSGQGEAMVANRINGIRAAVYYGEPKTDFGLIRLSREHNDANILSLGARFLTEEEAKNAVKLWLETKFTNEERHIRRIKKIEGYDKNHSCGKYCGF